MMKIKGNAEQSEHSKFMGRALGLKPEKKAEDMEPSPVSFDLGMPSAKKYMERQERKLRNHVDWGAHSNRINVGQEVFIKGKTEQARPRAADRERLRERRRVLKEAQELQNSELRPRREEDADADDESDSSELDLEDDEEVMAADRAKRLAEWKAAVDRQQQFLAQGHGKVTEVKEAEFLPIVTGSERLVCHFYHTEFERCKILDRHLAALSQAHVETRFIKIDADRAPFFVQKLQIRVLPSLVSFKKGIAVHRLLGFEGLGDNFGTAELERLLARQHQIIEDPVPAHKRAGFIEGKSKGKQQQQRGGGEDSEGSDDDDGRQAVNPIRRGWVGGGTFRDGSDADSDSD